MKISLYGYYSGTSTGNGYLTISNNSSTYRNSATDYDISGDVIEINNEKSNDVAENGGVLSTINSNRSFYVCITNTKLTNVQIVATSYRRIGTNA